MKQGGRMATRPQITKGQICIHGGDGQERISSPFVPVFQAAVLLQ